MTNESRRHLLRFAAIGAVTLLSAASLSATKNLTGAEYFWDDDPGVGNGTAIPSLAGLNPETTPVSSIGISTEGLSTGTHLLGLRVKTDDHWSVTTVANVTISRTYDRTITGAEYFWDDDPGVGNGIAIPSLAGLNSETTPLSSVGISTEGLSTGTHLLGLRVKTDDHWSVTTVANVTISRTYDRTITGAEYFWDNDPGVGNGIAIPSLAGLNSETTTLSSVGISTEGLSTGTHLLGLRVKTDDHWSVTTVANVTIPRTYDRTITGAEYFWDNDPGVGNGIAIPSLAGLNPETTSVSSVGISTDGLADGTHLLGMRLKTADLWSVTKFDRVTVKSGEAPLITAVEYFWGDDPGEGNGTAVEIIPARQIEINPLTIAFPDTDQESYTLSVRGMADGKWGAVTSWTRQNVPVEAITLNKTALALEAGNSETLTATVTPDDALFKDIDWLTDAQEIAMVNPDGLVEAKLQGVANISARSRRYPDVSSTCMVTVTDPQSAINEPESHDITITQNSDGIIISGEGRASGEVLNVSGIILAKFDNALPIHIPLAPGPYILTINGTIYKALIR